MQNWDSNTKNPIIPNFALCSLDLSYIWVQNLVTQINLTENQIFCEVEYPFYGTRSSNDKIWF